MTEQNSVRGTGSNGSLSEGEIVEAALRVVRTDGVAKLSMRRLSRELGVSPMAPYYYVADKSELLDLVAAAALAGVHAPRMGTWQERLRNIIDQVDEKLRKHPGLGDLMIEQVLDKQIDILAAVIEILFDAGFSERNALQAYATIHVFVFGRARTVKAPALPPRDQLPAAVARVLEHTAEMRPKHLYNFGVQTLIDGLEAQLVRAQARQ